VRSRGAPGSRQPVQQLVRRHAKGSSLSPRRPMLNRLTKYRSNDFEHFSIVNRFIIAEAR
jgi:hypothetical protein